MKSLIQFSMNKVAAMIILIAVILGAGLFSGTSLKVENEPNISIPVLMVSTVYQASPQDVMSEVTKPIEDRIANVEGLTMISSMSNDGYSRIILEFNEKVKIDKMKQDVESLIQDVQLPTGVGRPKVSSFGSSSFPAYYLAIRAEDTMSQSDLDQLFEQELKPSLESISGIDHMDTIGARSTSLDIQLDAAAIATFGLTPSMVTNFVKAAMSNGSVGVVEFNGDTQIARVQGELNSLFALENLEITSPAGTTLLLKDIANIQAVNEANFIARMDGKPAVGVHLYKSATTNAVEFSDEADALIRSWEETYPTVSFNKIYDSSDVVRGSISGLLKEGFLGVFLASLMILLFLRNIRMTVIVVVSIPLSILLTLIMMDLMNITLNIMSLGGMFIAVGRIVDDSIVVIESIYTNLEKAQKRNQSVILQAVKQVSMAISSSTFVTVGVFIPIAFLTGIIGAYFRPFAITVSCALLASLLVSLTVIPMMAKLMVLRSTKATNEKEHKGDKLATFYERALVWCLTHRIKTLLFSGLLLILTLIFTIPRLHLEVLPGGAPERQMNFSIKLPTDTPFTSTDLQAKQIETLLFEAKDENEEPLFTFVEALVGYRESEERFPYAIEMITEVNENADPTAVKEQYTQLIEAQLPQGSEVFPGSVAGGGGSSSIDFTYVIYGEDQQILEQASAVIKSKMKEFPVLKEIKDSLGEASTEVQITVNPSKAKLFGLDVSNVQMYVGEWLAKYELGKVRLDNTVYLTKVELASGDKNSLEQLGQMPIKLADGSVVFLNEVAKLEQVHAPVTLQRDSQKLMVQVTAKIDSPDKGAVSAEVTNALDQIELPVGVTTTTRGVGLDIMKNFNQMYAAMGAAIAIVYFIMVLCFGNAGTPFAILFSLPLAVIGGLLGLWVTKESISVTSLIGFLMLIGIVVTNAIVLLDRTQQLRQEGYLVRHALIESGKVRLRPIIMTAGATIAAMVPLALGLTHGMLISKGLAVVVIGGLITSTVLTLVVVPIIYEMIESFKARMSRLFKRKDPAGST